MVHHSVAPYYKPQIFTLSRAERGLLRRGTPAHYMYAYSQSSTRPLRSCGDMSELILITVKYQRRVLGCDRCHRPANGPLII